MPGINESMNSTMRSQSGQQQGKEHFWGCELSKSKPTYTWTFEEEEEDEDFLMHTLILKHAVLGVGASEGERNIIQVETKGYGNEDVKQPLLSLSLGKAEMCNLDVSFTQDTPVIFTLIEGNGPVYLSAQHFVEFPRDDGMDDFDEEDPEDLETAEEEDLKIEAVREGLKMAAKRKGGPTSGTKSKKGKMDVSNATEEDDFEDDSEDDDDEDMSEDDGEDEVDDSESSPEKITKKKPAAKKPKAVILPKAKGATTPTAAKGAKKAKKGKAK